MFRLDLAELFLRRHCLAAVFSTSHNASQILTEQEHSFAEVFTRPVLPAEGLRSHQARFFGCGNTRAAARPFNRI